MKLQLTKAITERLGEDRLRRVGREIRATRYDDPDTYTLVDLAQLTNPAIADLRGWLEEFHTDGLKGCQVLLGDMNRWDRAMEQGPSSQKPRTLRNFADLLTAHIAAVPGHRLYQRLDAEGIGYVGYYVSEIEFHPPKGSGENRQPPYVTMRMIYEDFGGRSSNTETWHHDGIQGKTLAEIMVRGGWFTETDEIRAAAMDFLQAQRQNPALGRLFIGDTPPQVHLAPSHATRFTKLAKLREDKLPEIIPILLHIAKRG